MTSPRERRGQGSWSRNVRLLPILALVLLGLAPTPARAVSELQLWHALDGPNGALLVRIAQEFNATQEAYKVIPIYKGTYAETISAGISAYRTGSAPHMLQVFEVGNGTMAAAVGAVKPASEVMREADVALAPRDFLPVIATNYLGDDGGMLSVPLNISSVVTWINRDRFREAGLDDQKLPTTWPEVFETARRLKEVDGSKCALSSSWLTWTHLEQLSAWHDKPLATRANGLDGYDTELVFNQPLQIRHLQNLVDLHREGVFVYTGRTNFGEARFLSGECAIFLTSSSLYGRFATDVRFDWAVVPMPYYPDVVTTPQNAIVGGGSLFVMQGKTKAEYEGVARFLAFILDVPRQRLLYRYTGYVPVTRAAYEAGLADGFFSQNPQLRVAVGSITRQKPTRNSAGLRFGNMLQIRDVWAEEIEAALNGAKTAKHALDDAVIRGNIILRIFQKRTLQ